MSELEENFDMTKRNYRRKHGRRPHPVRLSILLLALLTASLAGSVAAASAPAGARQADQTATASPGTGLVDFQVVDLSWSGYTPGAPVWFYTCSASASNVSDGCARAPSDPLESTTGSDGTGLIRYQVRATSFGKFQCDDSHACMLAVLENPTDLSSGAHASLSFVKPQGKCPGSKSPIVLGEGEPSAAYSMYGWESAACKLSSRPDISYTADNSYDGIQHFVSGLAQFAVSGVAPDSDEQQQLKDADRTYGIMPISASALVLAYNIVDQSGHQVTHLNLTPQIVAEIANGSLSTFYCPPSESDAQCTRNGGDPNIRKLNPGVTFPAGSINFFARAEQSSETLEFTSWLTATDPSAWPSGPTNVWPESVCETCGVQGAQPEALSVGFPQAYARTNIYIGVMDSTWAAIADIPVASIQNAPSVPAAVFPNAATVQTAIGDAAKNDDGTLTPDYSTTDPDAYPLPNLMFGIIPTSISTGAAKFSGESGARLKDFLTYAVGSDGQKNLPPGSYPLTDDLVTEANAVIDKIPTSGGGGGNNGNGGSNGNTGGSGTDTGFGTGTGDGFTPTPTPTDSASSPSPSPSPTIFIALGAHLSSPASSSVVPILAAVAVIGLLIGPLILLISRAAPRVVSVTSNMGSRRARGTGKSAPAGDAPTPDPDPSAGVPRPPVADP